MRVPLSRGVERVLASGTIPPSRCDFPQSGQSPKGKRSGYVEDVGGGEDKIYPAHRPRRPHHGCSRYKEDDEGMTVSVIAKEKGKIPGNDS